MRTSTSPFRGRSYTGNPESLELLIKSLERQNNSLVEQINVLKNKGRKVAELQDKIELVLKHNTQLLNQNQRLAKLINQKKIQVDTWRNKFQNFNSNKNVASDIQVKRLLNQIQKLKQDIVQMEHLKNLQINQIKNQSHIELQNIKRNNLGNAQKYQLEIRKLKQYCDKKQFQMSQLNMKIVRMSKQTQFEIGKLREEKQRLKNDLIYQENQHKRQVDSLKSKFDYNFHSEIENLKKQHLNQIQAIDYQNSKLKQVIASKNNQIQQIWIKNNKIKNNYEDSIGLLHRQNQQLKDKISQIQHISQLQMARLKDKLQGIKQSQVIMLKGAHNNQVDILAHQISKLQQIINDKTSQIQILNKQKNQLRISLENDITKAQNQLKEQINQNKDLQDKHQLDLKARDYTLKCKNQQLKTTQSYLKRQIDTINKERQTISQELSNRKQQLNRQRKENQQIKKKLQYENLSLKQKLYTLKDESQRHSRKSSSEIDDLKRVYDLKIKQLEQRINNIQNQKNQQQLLIKELKQLIENKNSQLKESQEKNNLLENIQRQVRKQLRQASNRWDIKEKQFNTLLRQQTKSMENIRKTQCQQIETVHKNKLNSLKYHIGQLQRQLQTKNKLLTDLKQKYQELVNKFEEIFAQRAAQKDLDIKVPGWLPDTLATKSLFDVFLKNKVLEYCS